MSDGQSFEGWYCLQGKEVIGPLSRRQLRQRADAGALHPRSMLWQGRGPCGELLLPVRASAVLREGRLVVLVVGALDGSGGALRTLVRRCGYDARLARPGTEALRLAKLCAPDVVFLDLDAPGVNAASLALQRGDHAPALVAVSNDGTEQARRRTQEAGFRYHLEKPPDANVLALLLALLYQERGAAAREDGSRVRRA